MTLYNYTERVDKIKGRVEKVIEQDKDTIHSLLFSSCLKRFYPSLPIIQHREFAKRVLFNQALAWEEQDDINLLGNCKIISNEVLDIAPKIYCSFHMSSYRLCMLYLLTNNIPLTLLASQNVIKEQGELIMQLLRRFSSVPSNSIINANNSSSIFSMIGELRKGRSLFVYIDGNTGASEKAWDNENLLEVDILASQIKVRTGISFLSKIMGVPIVPIISTRDEGCFPKIELLPSIFPNQDETKNRYMERSIKALYSALNKKLIEYPDQWEAWLYLYKFATKIIPKDNLPGNIEDKKIFSFNRQRYSLWDNKNQSYLMDNSDFSLITVDQKIRTLLGKREIYLSSDSSKIINDLIKRGIVQ